MLNYNVSLTEPELKVLHNLGIKDPYTRLNEEDVQSFCHDNILRMHLFGESTGQNTLSGKLFAVDQLSQRCKASIKTVTILTTLAAEFSLFCTTYENDPSAFTTDEQNLIAENFSRINLLDETGEIVQTCKLNDNQELPIAQLIDPRLLNRGCLEFIREVINKSNVSWQLPAESESKLPSGEFSDVLGNDYDEMLFAFMRELTKSTPLFNITTPPAEEVEDIAPAPKRHRAV